METALYKIEALTNMHVGSGDANYGVIDNLVQRDVVTNHPTINGSSLKGAVKEFFEKKWGKDTKLNEIFGSNDNNADYRFLSANLLAIPMRSNKKAYFLATCPAIIEQFNQDKTNFGFTSNLDAFIKYQPKQDEPIVFTSDTNDLLVENFGSFKMETPPGDCSVFKTCDNLIILNDEDFKELVDDFNLPVVARNKVGENKNLWYEQIVPSKSLFYFVVLHNNKNFDGDNGFNKVLQSDNVHIGANATVGYGFTKISKMD